MNLTPEQQEQGRRRFLQAVSAAPVMEAVREMSAVAAPPSGRALRVGFIGVGGQGRVLLGRSDPAYCDVRAMADVNPSSLKAADEVLAKANRPAARHYEEWREMLAKEDIEAVVLGVPLWLHAEVAVAAMEAGRHVLCEKMMAWDEAQCEAMKAASEKTGKVLEIGYQRYYNPTYVGAYHGVVKGGLLGDVYHARLVWHRNQTWRRKGTPPTPDFDPSRWGYPTFEHLLNWRLYWKYSKGLFAELGSHQANVVNWFLGAAPTRVAGSGGALRFKDREVQDHVYATWDYPGGRTATFSSIESNAMEGTYEAFFGTKGTLVMKGEREAFLFQEEEGSDLAADPALETATSAALAWIDPPGGGKRITSSQLQISTFVEAVQGKRALLCGAAKAMTSARACLGANASALKKSPLAIQA